VSKRIPDKVDFVLTFGDNCLHNVAVGFKVGKLFNIRHIADICNVQSEHFVIAMIANAVAVLGFCVWGG